MVDTTVSAIQSAIRDVPDFPKPGVVFKDITPLLMDAKLLAATVERMAAPYRDAAVTRVVAIESRGFLIGAPIAVALRAGLVPIRRPRDDWCAPVELRWWDSAFSSSLRSWAAASASALRGSRPCSDTVKSAKFHRLRPCSSGG